MKAIGHPTARRQQTSHGWQYVDKINQSLEIYLSMKSCALHDLDAFIERLEVERAPAGKELRARRKLAYEAYSSTPKNHDAVARHIEWIKNRKREIESSELMEKPVRTGVKVSSGGKKGTDKQFGTEEEKKAIRSLWQTWVNETFARLPKLSYEAIKQKVVSEHESVTLDQLKRWTSNPRKK